MLRRSFCLTLPGAMLSAAAFNGTDARTERAGWVVVRLAGTPTEIGQQHGALLANEIGDLLRCIRILNTHDSGKDWNFFRTAAEQVLWPRIEQEYRDELQGIVAGAASKGVQFDVNDLVAMNAFQELDSYYTDWYDHKRNKKTAAPDHCSAFVATGSWTKDGRPVIAHNNWTDYATGPRWNIIFDVKPAKGKHFLMDGLPGLIHSGDDFGINTSGIMITETTISNFRGFDPKGIAEFVRARKAMQYSASIDDFTAIMKDGNNGGYANNWLVADCKKGEVASLELGLKHVTLQRTSDGYFVGANFPVDPQLIHDEAHYDPNNTSSSPCARHKRWEMLMAENKGKIDVEAAKRFLADHYDTHDKKEAPSERTLCGHNELSPRGMMPWQPAYGPAGAVQNKVADARLCEQMSMWAAMGHACGMPFIAKDHLAQHSKLAWEKDIVADLKPGGWALFQAGSYGLRPAQTYCAPQLGRDVEVSSIPTLERISSIPPPNQVA
jgi:hypothetical protein